MPAIIRGSAEVSCAPLSMPEASSAEGLAVARWAERPARLARMDRLCALGLVACDGALVDARVSPGDATWRSERVGIVLGTAYGCHATNEAYYRGFLAHGVEGASPRLFAYTLPSSPVGEITIHHRILGPASTTIGGQVAALDALAEALRHLDAGRADRMLVGAADVAGAMLTRLGGSGARDGAAALLLERHGDGPQVVRVIRRFRDGDPAAAALDAALALDAGEATLYAPGALLERLAARLHPTARHALDPTAQAAAPLLALRLATTARRAAVVVAADASGLAAAVSLAA